MTSACSRAGIRLYSSLMAVIFVKLVDSSVIFVLVEFIYNLLNVVVTKLFFVFSYKSVKK